MPKITISIEVPEGANVEVKQLAEQPTKKPTKKSTKKYKPKTRNGKKLVFKRINHHPRSYPARLHRLRQQLGIHADEMPNLLGMTNGQYQSIMQGHKNPELVAKVRVLLKQHNIN